MKQDLYLCMADHFCTCPEDRGFSFLIRQLRRVLSRRARFFARVTPWSTPASITPEAMENTSYRRFVSADRAS